MNTKLHAVTDAKGRAVHFQIGRVDHDGLVIGAFGGQARHDPDEDALFTPAFPAVVESFGRTILPRRITPPQTIAINEDYATQNPSIINPGLAMALGGKRFQALNLRLDQPVKIAQPPQFGSLNHTGQTVSSGLTGPEPSRGGLGKFNNKICSTSPPKTTCSILLQS